MKESNKALIYTGIAIASWSTVASAFKIALRYMTHFELILVSAITTLLILSVVMIFSRKWDELKSVQQKDWMRFAFIGLLNPAAYYLVLFKAYSLLPAQIAQPINYFWPILLVIMLATVLRERIAAYKFIGMFVSFTGVALISFGTEWVSDESLSETGIALAFLSAFLWASFWILNRKMAHIDSIVALFLSFLFGSVYLLAATLVIPVSFASLKGLGAGVYVGAFEMAVPFIFFGMALRTTSNPALVNQLTYLSPFISLFLIYLILGESIYSTTYIGLSLIVAGILLNEWLGKRKVKSVG